jgi:aminoglycoside 6'-N-acetyltransferase I
VNQSGQSEDTPSRRDIRVDTTRRAELADAGPIAVLSTQLGYPLDEGSALERLRTAASMPGGVQVAVAKGGSLLGFASYSIWYGLADGALVCRLAALVVAPAAQRKGTGRALVNAVEAAARLAKCSVIELSSGRGAARKNAHHFYPSLGYDDTSSHHAHYVKRLI